MPPIEEKKHTIQMKKQIPKQMGEQEKEKNVFKQENPRTTSEWDTKCIMTKVKIQINITVKQKTKKQHAGIEHTSK